VTTRARLELELAAFRRGMLEAEEVLEREGLRGWARELVARVRTYARRRRRSTIGADRPWR